MSARYRVSQAPDYPHPEAVLEQYRRMVEVVETFARGLRAGVPVPPTSRFFGEPIGAVVDVLSRELDAQGTMMLVASFEAALRVDYLERVNGRWKDSDSKVLRRLPKRPRFHELRVEDILGAWKRATMRTQAVGCLVQLFKYRNWLAHGRFWVQTSGVGKTDPLDAWRRWQLFLSDVAPESFPAGSRPPISP